MKKVFVALLVTLSSSIAYAGCIGPTVNGKCLGTNVGGASSDSGYQGSSGLNYQYDLSNGSDRNSYSIDLEAQRRDQMNLDVGRTMDQSRGQYGGGVGY